MLSTVTVSVLAPASTCWWRRRAPGPGIDRPAGRTRSLCSRTARCWPLWRERREPLISADCTFAQIQSEKKKRLVSCGHGRNLWIVFKFSYILIDLNKTFITVYSLNCTDIYNTFFTILTKINAGFSPEGGVCFVLGELGHIVIYYWLRI